MARALNFLHQRQQHKREHERGAVVDREADAAPLVAALVLRRAGRAAEDLRGHRRHKVDPHAEQREPGEELHDGKLPHRLGHGTDPLEDLAERVAQAGRLRLHAAERLQVLRRIFPRGQDGVEHGENEHRRADVEGQLHRRAELLPAPASLFTPNQFVSM